MPCLQLPTGAGMGKRQGMGTVVETAKTMLLAGLLVRPSGWATTVNTVWILAGSGA